MATTFTPGRARSQNDSNFCLLWNLCSDFGIRHFIRPIVSVLVIFTVISKKRKSQKMPNPIFQINACLFIILLFQIYYKLRKTTKFDRLPSSSSLRVSWRLLKSFIYMIPMFNLTNLLKLKSHNLLMMHFTHSDQLHQVAGLAFLKRIYLLSSR